jgi:hypothetical protein
MRESWNNLIQYGYGIATIFVLTVGAICLFLIVGLAILTTKFLVFIK